jgi:hypothetical protein
LRAIRYSGAHELDTAKLNDWIQILGIFALVASLIFVGFQIRQTQEIAESEAYQNRAAAAVELQAMQASSPDFMSAMAKLYAGNDGELTAQEKVTAEYFFGAEIMTIENVHFQFEAGYLPKEDWERSSALLRCALSHPFYRDVTSGWMFRASFQTVVDQIKASVLTDPSDCWE